MPSMKEELDQLTTPPLCTTGCGFYVNKETGGFCSSCYKADVLKKKSSSEVPKIPDVTSNVDNQKPVENHHQSNEVVKKRNRCHVCSKRVGLVPFLCRCGESLCGLHRMPEKHACKFDFKAAGRVVIEKQNPLCVADKLEFSEIYKIISRRRNFSHGLQKQSRVITDKADNIVVVMDLIVLKKGLRGSKKLKEGALSQYVGHGHRAAIEAIRTYHLELPSGLVIVLNNCHYTRGVISVLRLFDDIPTSCSNTNDNSMYAITNKRDKINLDSSLLWYCRLGHISKKRIKKLKHDGLHNSIDIESLGKCVSCLSGKMARRPYSHKVKRAKDLLGLIHTDEHGIIAHHTPPYTSQKNEVSERRNQTLLDMVQSMTSQTTLPKSFWDYALETAARILNMVPTKKVEKTPYKETMGYSFYSLYENKVFVAWNAEFFESKLLDLKASRGKEDLKLIQEEDTNPSVDTSLNNEEDDQEIDEPQSDINPIRRSARTCHPTDQLCLYIDAEEYKLGDLGEPANYKAALLDLESKKWFDVMNIEMQSIKDNDVWVLAELPPNARTLGSKWLFKKKTDIDGAVYIFKARLVVKGFTQTYEVDYEETFSRVADIRDIRILIAIAAYYDYETWKMDVKTAFLNGHLSEEVYMEQPEGFMNPKYPNHEAVWICKFIPGLGIVPTIEEPISIYCENTKAIEIAKDDGVTKGARHFHVKVYYLCETIKLGDVKIEKIDTYDNLADPFTKALAFSKHSELTRNIGLLPTSNFM
nr:retrovirus-related Pol polyprotein from transposon TNT 1-94 [Tanacetum cinerariifolium]